MDYKIGSLADLISGNKTPNKTNVVQKTFIPVKKELVEEAPSTGKSNKKTKKKFNVSDKDNLTTPTDKNETFTPVKKELKEERSTGKPNKKTKKKFNSSDNDNLTTHTEKKNFSKSKVKKRKVDSLNIDLADSDAEQPSPKKQKLSKNEENAAGRIKNKINKDTKNSGEYKDKTLFVGNIPINLKKEKIKKRFRKYGAIDSVRIRGIPVADPKTTKKVAAIKKEFHPDRNTVYAFIRFQNAEDAKKAEVENGELFQDHHLRVHCCESEDKPDESKAIFVGNLAFNAEEEELWQLFKPCGPISHVRIVRDGRTSMSKGFGYVNFKDTDSVQLALEMEKVMLKERELRISVCDSSRAKKKKTPRNRNSRQNPKNQENGDDNSSKKKKTFRIAKMNPNKFSGSKFDDKKKKRKFNKTAIEKKNLAKKLVAPKPNLQ